MRSDLFYTEQFDPGPINARVYASLGGAVLSGWAAFTAYSERDQASLFAWGDLALTATVTAIYFLLNDENNP